MKRISGPAARKQDAAPDEAVDHEEIVMAWTDPNVLQRRPEEDVGSESENDNENEELYGIHVFEAKSEHQTGIIDIVAVHGLNGHYRKTWTALSEGAKGECWLQDFLPEQIPNARIMSFGYNSAVQFSKSVADIGTFAEGLLEDLMARRITTTERSRPIMFVCHSLGGIVFKQVSQVVE